jgi:hypothetical protein
VIVSLDFLFSLSLLCVTQDPKRPAAELKAHYDGIVKEIEDAFLTIVDV